MSETIVRWIPIILAAGVFLAAIFIAVRYKIPALAKRMDRVELVSHKQQVTVVDMADTVKKHELYNKNGTARYQHANDCSKIQGTYCKKIDEVKAEIGDIKTQLKDMAKTRMQEVKDLAQTMTRVQGMIEKDRADELQLLANMVISKIKE